MMRHCGCKSEVSPFKMDEAFTHHFQQLQAELPNPQPLLRQAISVNAKYGSHAIGSGPAARLSKTLDPVGDYRV